MPDSFSIPLGCYRIDSVFKNCTSLEKLPSDFIIHSGVTMAGGIVTGCTNLKELPSGFILPENYSGSLLYFFRDCTNLKTIPDGFTIPAGVTDISHMFRACTSLESLPDSFSIPESYTGGMNHMFYQCFNLQRIPDNFTIPTGVTNVTHLFSQDKKIKGSITMLGNPEKYDYCFSNTAIESNGTLTINYSKNCTNIDAILKTGNATYVVKGKQVD